MKDSKVSSASVTNKRTEHPSQLFSGWMHWALRVGMGVSLFFFMAVPILCIGSYFYLKPRYQLAQTFDLKKLESENLALDRVPINETSTHFINALISAEDPDFYEHHGVDFARIVRAVRGNYLKNENRGASTVTQMLVRIAFAEELQEYRINPTLDLYIAYWVERHLNKGQILELYTNRVYFGDGCYGLAAASKSYFGKSQDDLSVAEAATLVGMIRNPYYRSPKLFPESAREARDYVLAQMYLQGFIDKESMNTALDAPIGGGIPGN